MDDHHGDESASAEAPPPLLTQSDIARRLGVSRQRVYQLRTRHWLFPAPMEADTDQLLWDPAAIDEFARLERGSTTRRSYGRPKSPRSS